MAFYDTFGIFGAFAFVMVIFDLFATGRMQKEISELKQKIENLEKQKQP